MMGRLKKLKIIFSFVWHFLPDCKLSVIKLTYIGKSGMDRGACRQTSQDGHGGWGALHS